MIGMTKDEFIRRGLGDQRKRKEKEHREKEREILAYLARQKGRKKYELRFGKE